MKAVRRIAARGFFVGAILAALAGSLNAAGTSQQPWGSHAELELILSDGSVYPKKGSFLAADREVDLKTGTIRLSATLADLDAWIAYRRKHGAKGGDPLSARSDERLWASR